MPDNNLTLGEFLRQERERRGVTIEQVASATKINVRLLHSLEADHYADLPAKPFVRGFVTSYARFVGLNPREILTRFGDFIDRKAHDRPNREAGHSGYAFEKREGEQSRTLLWFILGGFVIFGGLTLAVVRPGGFRHHHGTHADKLRETYNASPSPSPSEALAIVKPLASPSPSPSPVAAATAEPSPTPTIKSNPSPKPKPSPSPKPSPKPSPSPKPTPSPTPTATPRAAPSAKPSPQPSETTELIKPTVADPLNSGLGLKNAEIRYKIIFKALSDVWVRYQIDNRTAMHFIVRQGKVLVLRAKDSVRFQASDPGSIEFSFNGAPMTLLARAKSVVDRKGDLTLLFPFETLKTVEDTFPGERPLKDRPIPPPRAPQSISTPSP